MHKRERNWLAATEAKTFEAEESVFFPVGEERGTVRGLISSVLCLIFLGETAVYVPTLADLKAKLLPLCPRPRDPDSGCLLFFQAYHPHGLPLLAVAVAVRATGCWQLRCPSSPGSKSTLLTKALGVSPNPAFTKLQAPFPASQLPPQWLWGC